MKQATFLSLLLVFTFVLTSCMFYLPSPYKLSQSEENISEIEIYYIEGGIEHPERNDTLIPIATVLGERHESFIGDLQELPFKVFVLVFPPAAIDPYIYFNGYTVKIIYKDGSADYICPNVQATCTGDKRVDGSYYECDDVEWIEFIKKYINDISIKEEELGESPNSFSFILPLLQTGRRRVS